ncbi:MAG: GlsB/YeaQ/YmgE family stress response membrane protein [Roseiflexaceae bacterium]
MGIIAWLIFGALAGWVASMIAGTNQRMGCFLNIVVGIVGAFIGGFLYSLLTGTEFVASFDITSFIIAVAGAVILLLIVTGFRRRSI